MWPNWNPFTARYEDPTFVANKIRIKASLQTFSVRAPSDYIHTSQIFWADLMSPAEEMVSTTEEYGRTLLPKFNENDEEKQRTRKTMPEPYLTELKTFDGYTKWLLPSLLGGDGVVSSAWRWGAKRFCSLLRRFNRAKNSMMYRTIKTGSITVQGPRKIKGSISP